jgi:hypothetical protein
LSEEEEKRGRQEEETIGASNVSSWEIDLSHRTEHLRAVVIVVSHSCQLVQMTTPLAVGPDMTTTQQIHLRGEEARKTIEDMHAVWTMENEEAHDAGRESESREPSTHCTGRCWGCDPLELCLRTVAPMKPSTASTSLCRCDRMDVQFSRGLDQLSV